MTTTTSNMKINVPVPFTMEAAKSLVVKKRDYPVIALMVILHAMVLFAPFTFTWGRLGACLIWYSLGALGITVGYHRLVTHKSYQVPRWLYRFWAFLGATAIEGGPLTWCSEHRVHHAKSDTEYDLHNIHEGFMHAHIGWMFQHLPSWYTNGMVDTYAPDLKKDPFLRFLEKYHVHMAVLAGVLIAAVGGFGAFVWVFCVKQVALWHATWCVNSASHIWGYRHFPKEQATNNWWVALLTMGEGWHNTHHAFPTSARHGLRWWEFDASWITIWTMRSLGLAKKVKLPSREELPWINKSLRTTPVVADPIASVG